MTPREAAQEYLRLETVSIAEAIRFAMAYENSASARDYAAYLQAFDA